jgi:hypothetical protein
MARGSTVASSTSITREAFLDDTGRDGDPVHDQLQVEDERGHEGDPLAALVRALERDDAERRLLECAGALVAAEAFALERPLGPHQPRARPGQLSHRNDGSRRRARSRASVVPDIGSDYTAEATSAETP